MTAITATTTTTTTMTTTAPEPSEFTRVVSALTFYVFSCSCLQRPPPTKATSHLTQSARHLWREEIESGPSLLLRSGTGSSAQPIRSNTGSLSLPSTPNSEFYPQSPVCMISDSVPYHHTGFRKEPAMTMIHPPINERHPPVVSAVSGSTQWMTLPPPTASAIHSLNRHINAQRERSGSVLSLEEENMLPIRTERRARYKEDILEDMDAPKPLVRREDGLVKAQMVQLPPPTAVRG